MLCIIFSKDRALQLDATLRSLREKCLDVDKLKVVVLYTTSRVEHKVTKSGMRVKDKIVSFYQTQYDTLMKAHPNVEFIHETNFKTDLLRIIMRPMNSYVMFAVDDTIFIREFSVKHIQAYLENNVEAIGFSLRLGANTTYCYMTNKKQTLPKFETVDLNVLKFNWVHEKHDFGYPFEISSSVYRIPEVLIPLQLKDYNTPNTLEASIHKSIDFFKFSLPMLLCYKNSVAFSNPLNLVQAKKTNRCSKNIDTSIIHLSEKFKNGYMIDLSKYYNITTNAVHQEEPVVFIKREMV